MASVRCHLLSPGTAGPGKGADGQMGSVWPWLSRHGYDAPSLLSGDVGMNEAPPSSPTPTWGWTGSQEMVILRARAAHSFPPPQYAPLPTHTHTHNQLGLPASPYPLWNRTTPEAPPAPTPADTPGASDLSGCWVPGWSLPLHGQRKACRERCESRE